MSIEDNDAILLPVTLVKLSRRDRDTIWAFTAKGSLDIVG
jgi:hypothetical protein